MEDAAKKVTKKKRKKKITKKVSSEQASLPEIPKQKFLTKAQMDSFRDINNDIKHTTLEAENIKLKLENLEYREKLINIDKERMKSELLKRKGKLKDLEGKARDNVKKISTYHNIPEQFGYNPLTGEINF